MTCIECGRQLDEGDCCAVCGYKASPRSESEKEAARRYIRMSRELLAKWKAVK